MRHSRSIPALGGVAAVSIAVAVTLAGPPALADADPTGSAFAVSAEATLLNAVNAAVGPLPQASFPAGDDKSVVKLDTYNDVLLTARLLNAASAADGGKLTSDASIADVNALGLISAKLVAAGCVADESGVHGSAKLVDVLVAGTPITVDGSNEIKIGDEIVVRVNEQIREGNTLTVNALHVIVGGTLGGVAQADVVLSQAKCTAGGAGIPTSTTSPTDTPTSTPTATSTSTSTSGPGTTSSSTTSSSTEVTQPGGSGNNNDDGGGALARTGASAIMPLSIGGLVLLAGGAAAILLVRRRRAELSS